MIKDPTTLNIDPVALANAVNSHSPTVDFSEAQLKVYQRQLEDDAAIDLEENAPPPVTVLFREYVSINLKDTEGQDIPGPDGQPLKGTKPVERLARIETYVPTEILMETVALQKKMESLKESGLTDIKAIMDIYVDQVLRVWQLSEPDMTRARLIKGLDYTKIRGLFARFFVSLSGPRS